MTLTREAAEEILQRFRAEAAAATTDQEVAAVAGALEAWVRRVRAQQWERYPWQHPHRHPDGWVSQRAPGKEVCDERCLLLPRVEFEVHDVWLQRGGRGTGKTEGAAHYINEHAESPPCDSRAPGGHRFTIVAPTQADAVSSCVNGISGLKAINPAITVSTGSEGTIARWPNGVVAKLLGAHTSKDVDRARAWSNVCVSEGSLVETEHGPIPIEHVRPGDRVWTRTGLRRVVQAGATGVRPVVRVEADGVDVWVTPDHPVARPDGSFTRADAGGSVLVWLKQRSSTTAAHGPNATTATTGTAANSSTDASTSARWGRSPTAGTSTTTTSTSSTTRHRTWWPSRRPSTRPATPHTGHRNGTLLAVGRRLLHGPRWQAPASSAAPASRAVPPSRSGSARRDARNAEHRHEHTSHGCARCAAEGSPAPAGTAPAPVARIAAVSPPTRLAQVYDLAVEGHHEFYAGGLLVGNCLWWLEEAAAQPQLAGMLEQGPYTLRLGDRPHTVATSTPQNRPEVVALIDGPQPTDPEHIRIIERATVQTWGRTRDAHRLPAPVRKKLEDRYAGTTAGAQELDGDLIADVPGALWVSHRPDEVDGAPNTDHRPGIGNDRVAAGSVGWISHPRPAGLGGDDAYNEPIQPPTDVEITVTRTIVAIDPPGGRTECGITVLGTAGTHGYVLADLSGAFTPDVWARIALEAYYDYGAEGLAVEHTYGGDMVPEVIGSRAELLGVPAPPIFKVPTKVGKRLRAEPVQALYQQHRMHHVGILPGLETEQRTWIPNETTDSPNRIDAHVHGATYLLIRARAGSVSNPTRLPTSRRMPTTFGNRRTR